MATTVWLAPGAEAMSEFARKSDGSYHTATCVETGTLMCAVGQRPGMLPMTGDELQTMINQWQVNDPSIGPNGASSYVDATVWLRNLGFQVDENVISGDWWAELQHGIGSQHCVYLVGVTNAQGLPGDESGVHNHGLCAFGIDSDGNIICGDPDNWRAQVNMPGNPIGEFVTYTQQDFINGSISSLTKVYPSMLDITNPFVAGHFTQESDGSWLCNQAYHLPSEPASAAKQHRIAMGLLKFYQSVPSAGSLNGMTALGLPLSDEHFSPDGVLGVSLQFFAQGYAVFDPDRKWSSPLGAVGECYIGNLTDPRVAPFLAVDNSAEVAQLKAELATAQQSLAHDQLVVEKDVSELDTIKADTTKLQADETAPAQ